MKLNDKNINFEHILTYFLVEKIRGGTVREGGQLKTLRYSLMENGINNFNPFDTEHRVKTAETFSILRVVML